MNERALLAIVKALDGYVEPPGLDWPDYEQKEVIFTHWALDEILSLVWDHPWTPASETIERFAAKLEAYAEMSLSEDQKWIFVIASETAWEMLEEIKLLEY